MLEITYNSKNGHVSKIRFNEVSIKKVVKKFLKFPFFSESGNKYFYTESDIVSIERV